MTTVKFSMSEFEDALTNSQIDKSIKLWEYVGFLQGEHCYKIRVNERVSILIRSSIEKDGYAADTGENSIRLWLVNSTDNKPLAKSVDAYTQRVIGWEARLKEKIREVYNTGVSMVNCPKCSGVMIERKGAYGKFYGCSNYPNCKHTMKSLPVIKQQYDSDSIDLIQLTEQKTVSSEFVQSVYQSTIFDFIQNGNGNAVIEAVAGS